MKAGDVTLSPDRDSGADPLGLQDPKVRRGGARLIAPLTVLPVSSNLSESWIFLSLKSGDNTPLGCSEGCQVSM